MGRRHSPKHYQTVVDNWRDRLLTVVWVRRGSGNAQLLAATLGIDAAASDTVHWKRLRDAAVLLHRAIVAVSDGSARPDALDEWIDRYLLRRGPTPLLSDAQRRRTLARVRDASRRQAHAERGLHSARIEMRIESWTRLEAIRAELETGATGKVTFGGALERIIAAYGAKSPAAPPKRGPNRKPSEEKIRVDLFAYHGAKPLP